MFQRIAWTLVALLALTAPTFGQFGQISDLTKDAGNKSVEQLIEEALAAHKSGNSDEAIQLLQLAIDGIQQKGMKGITSHLPPVPENWTADEAKTVTGNWGSGAQAFQWSQVSRVYTSQDGMRVNVTFTNSPQVLMAQRQMAATFGNEQMVKMMNMDPNKQVDVFKKDGWNGWTMIEGNKANGVGIGNKYVVTVDVNRGNKDVFTKFWKSVNFDGLNKK